MRLEPPSWWYEGKIPIAAWSLLPVSALYGALAERRFRTASPYRSRLPVVCVGNFTMGGAGKTPVALKICSLLRDSGRKPAFLTRGYGGRERGPHLVRLDEDSPERVGDEPLLLAQTATTIVSRDRPTGAKLIESLGYDSIIMDDGFQNPTLYKDFSLIVVDGESGFGSGRVFPLGPLRAPLAFQAAKADAILVLGKSGNEGNLVPGLEKTFPSWPAVEGENHARWLRQVSPLQRQRGERSGEGGLISPSLALKAGAGLNFGAEIVPIPDKKLLSGSHLAFCGIGRPSKFFHTLHEAGIPLAKCRSFPDHHPYSEADARSLIEEAESLNASLVTTEKDHVRLKGRMGALGELYRSATALPIQIKFADQDESRLMLAITNALSARRV